MEKIKEKTIKETGQEMYFNERITQTMIGREENIEHISTAQAVENIFLSEIESKDGLQVAELGAGAHPKRYEKLLEFLKANQGKIQWVDQAPIMLDAAQKQISDKECINFVEAEMVSYLEKNKERFDALILKYSFNYVVSVSLKEWLKTIEESLKKNGIVVATLNLYEGGLKPRSFNAVYTINGEPITQEYKPRHGDIIEIHFLKTGGDKSPNPETFADTKIIYYSPEEIKKVAEEVGFFFFFVIDDWSKNEKWLQKFKENYPNSEIKSKSMLLLKK